MSEYNIKIKPPFTPGQVKDILKQAELSQKELAEAFGISESAVSQYINGESASEPFWLRFKEFFGVGEATVEELVSPEQ